GPRGLLGDVRLSHVRRPLARAALLVASAQRQTRRTGTCRSFFACGGQGKSARRLLLSRHGETRTATPPRGADPARAGCRAAGGARADQRRDRGRAGHYGAGRALSPEPDLRQAPPGLARRAGALVLGGRADEAAPIRSLRA